MEWIVKRNDKRQSTMKRAIQWCSDIPMYGLSLSLWRLPGAFALRARARKFFPDFKDPSRELAADWIMNDTGKQYQSSLSLQAKSAGARDSAAGFAIDREINDSLVKLASIDRYTGRRVVLTRQGSEWTAKTKRACNCLVTFQLFNADATYTPPADVTL